MANSIFLNYGTSYFDLLSDRIDTNEAEIVDVGFNKLNKPDPLTPNALLYVKDLSGNTASSTILCQSNNALQSVGCLQFPGTAVNPATTIPELSGKSQTTVWLSSANGHLYRGTKDLEVSSGGSGDVVGAASSTNNALVRFDATTGKLIKNSLTTLEDTGYINFPLVKTPLRMNNIGLVAIDRTNKILGLGREINNVNTVMVGIVDSDSTSLTNGIIVGNNSSESAGGIGRVDVIIVGNNVGTATGDKSIVLGNRVCAIPTSTFSLGTKNIALGHDIQIRNGSVSNILMGNDAKVYGNSNILMGDSVFGSGTVGTNNVILGYNACKTFDVASTVSNNVLIGTNVLTLDNGNASNNIMIGNDVGSAITTSVNNCLWVDNSGVNGESDSIRIGKVGKTACYISGIYSGLAPTLGQKNVKINSDGRLVGSNILASYGRVSYLDFVTFYTITTATGVAFEPVPPSLISSFSPDGRFVLGANNFRIKYVGVEAVKVKVNVLLNFGAVTISYIGAVRLYVNGILISTQGVYAGVTSNSNGIVSFPALLDLVSGDEVKVIMQTDALGGTIQMKSQSLELMVIA